MKGEESDWARLRRELFYSLRSSPVVVVAALIAVFLILSACFASVVSPFNPTDISTINLLDSEIPPGIDARYLLGTDGQGRDVLSAILYGMRTSLLVGFGSVLLSMIVGVSVGLLAGYLGGTIDAVVMRVADVILSFPSVLIALLVNGIALGILPASSRENSAGAILILSIALNEWVKYARTVRGATMVERSKEYVQAARMIGIPSAKIMSRHVLPNVLSPVFVIATISLALAILTEATLSFLGVGMPPTQPSLGTLIRVGNEFLFSGIWWVVVFPSITLVLLVLSVNIVGDWLRDVMNPKLR